MFTAPGSAQLVKCWSADREVTGLIPAGPTLGVLKQTRTKVLPLQRYRQMVSRPLHGSDDHVEMAVPSPVGDVKTVSSISTFVLNTLKLK